MPENVRHSIVFLICLGLVVSCKPAYNIIIKNGNVYDGSGGPAYKADVGIVHDKIRAIGDLSAERAEEVIDASGFAVSPGFINMLSWANNSLLRDGRSMGDIKQGVTLEVLGEGTSMGPLSEKMKAETDNPPAWTTLGEYLEHVEEKGIATNVASFVGATTIRVYVLGHEDREPTNDEMQQMVALVKEAMEQGAMGVSSSLIYAPAFFADTRELVKLAAAAAHYDGLYITHMRSEGNKLLAAVDEFLTVVSKGGIDGEIYHLKAAGENNWGKLDAVLDKIDSARKSGLQVGANMYTYTAASTGLDATMPPWVKENGTQAWLERLKDPKTRSRIVDQMNSETTEWENFLQMSGDPENILLVSFDQDSLKYLTAKTLAEVAEMKNTEPAETIVDLILANGGDIGAVFFLMTEENVKRQIKIPYMSFGSDAGSMAIENNRYHTHPRAYGNFARLLGKYVREERVIGLNEAIRRLTSLSADKLKIKERGRLIPGYYADIVVFDPATIMDKATFDQPHQYAEGVQTVLVNGVVVLKDGKHTGATPGRAIRGPGYKPQRPDTQMPEGE